MEKIWKGIAIVGIWIGCAYATSHGAPGNIFIAAMFTSAVVAIAP